MMNKVSVIQGQISQNKANFAVLRSGSVVTGRVLARNGDGSYSVSLAGQKISVRSETPLKAGSLFSAKVSVKGEVVTLSLVKENVSSEILQKIGGSSQISPQLANLLTSLGFEPNAESFKILQFMQQLGMKIDVPEAKKALKRAENSENKEEKAQVSLLLDEKGIASDEEKIEAVIGQNGKNSGGKDSDREKGNPQKQNKQPQIKNTESLKKSVRSYFDSVDSASLSHKAGILSAFNTVLSSPSKNPPLKHWILLPFEWNFNNYAGDIRLLFDSDLKNLEKVIVRLENESKKRVFVLFYKGGKVASVKFASSVESDSAETKAFSSLICMALGNKVDVSSMNIDELKGFCSDDEKFALLDGRA